MIHDTHSASQSYTLNDWLSCIEHQHPIKQDYDRTRLLRVAQTLDLFPMPCPVVVVGGTNGKGTCISALIACAQVMGLSNFAFTSPHVHRYNERFVYNAQMLSDEVLCQSFEVIEEARGVETLTYFEHATLLAWLQVHRLQPDVAFFEIGLGGRLDAVNLMEPDVSVITSVGLDHQDILGETIEAIATEKAHIGRPHRPLLFLGDPIPPAIKRHAHRHQIRLSGLPHLELLDDSCQSDHQRYLCRLNGHDTVFNIPYGLHPRSVLGALFAFQHLFQVTDLPEPAEWVEQCKQACRTLSVPGRWQRIDVPWHAFADVAHNPDAMAHLLSQMHRYQGTRDHWHVAFAAMADKDWQGMMQLMDPYVQTWWPVRLADCERAITADAMYHYAEKNLRAPVQAPEPPEAIWEQWQQAHRTRALSFSLITGSFITVDRMLRSLKAD